MLITLTNDFHGTEAAVRGDNMVGRGKALSAVTVRRTWRALCGIEGCTCGGVLGQRGPQSWSSRPVEINDLGHGEAMIRVLPR